ncbi:hypothetical protein PS847_01317 [Pseudomonas fluorescens]|uniref:Uncharacterized protein n=1 Tax=Pseudomonas fluorescens TaxID=294 RepID=A0A5E7I382_PSEFL|nr:hypothetical protein PS847_01317 [Pseudomonas fluorescens]
MGSLRVWLRSYRTTQSYIWKSESLERNRPPLHP